MTIDGPPEWCRLVEQDWDDLVALFRRYDLGQDVTGIEQTKRRRDARFARRLIAARRHAPHRREVGTSAGWRLLCDLCDEQPVLHRGAA